MGNQNTLALFQMILHLNQVGIHFSNLTVFVKLIICFTFFSFLDDKASSYLSIRQNIMYEGHCKNFSKKIDPAFKISYPKTLCTKYYEKYTKGPSVRFNELF